MAQSNMVYTSSMTRPEGAMNAATIRVPQEIRDALLILRRELSVKYSRDYTIGEVITSLVNSHKPGNPQLTKNLQDIIARMPEKETP